MQTLFSSPGAACTYAHGEHELRAKPNGAFYELRHHNQKTVSGHDYTPVGHASLDQASLAEVDRLLSERARAKIQRQFLRSDVIQWQLLTVHRVVVTDSSAKTRSTHHTRTWEVVSPGKQQDLSDGWKRVRPATDWNQLLSDKMKRESRESNSVPQWRENLASRLHRDADEIGADRTPPSASFRSVEISGAEDIVLPQHPQAKVCRLHSLLHLLHRLHRLHWLYPLNLLPHFFHCQFAGL